MVSARFEEALFSSSSNRALDSRHVVFAPRHLVRSFELFDSLHGLGDLGVLGAHHALRHRDEGCRFLDDLVLEELCLEARRRILGLRRFLEAHRHLHFAGYHGILIAVMPREKDPFREHVVLQNDVKKTWKCKFCEKDFHGGATRIKAHLGGVRGGGIQGCEKVDVDVKAKARDALLPKKEKVTGSGVEGPSKKRREGNFGAALTSTSDPPYEGGTNLQSAQGPMDISSPTPTHFHSHVSEGGAGIAGSSSSQDLNEGAPMGSHPNKCDNFEECRVLKRKLKPLHSKEANIRSELKIAPSQFQKKPRMEVVNRLVRAEKCRNDFHSEEVASTHMIGDLQNIMPTYILNEKNYLKWSHFVRTNAKGKGKLRHLLGTGPKKGDPDFDVWDEADSMIMSWLWDSMEPAIRDTCILLPTAKEIWDFVRRTYSKARDAAQVYEIKVKISGTKQGGKTVTEYANSLQNLWQELDHYRVVQMRCPDDAAILKSIIEKDRVYGFLAGLNSEFDQVRIQILGKEEVPSLEETISLIRAEESRRSVMLESQAVEGSALTTRKVDEKGDLPRKDNRDSLWCAYCKKPRYTKEQCWKLHGRPTTSSREWVNRATQPRPRVHLTEKASQEEVQEKATFSSEEIENLRSLSGSLNEPSGACSLALSGFGEEDGTC